MRIMKSYEIIEQFPSGIEILEYFPAGKDFLANFSSEAGGSTGSVMQGCLNPDLWTDIINDVMGALFHTI